MSSQSLTVTLFQKSSHFETKQVKPGFTNYQPQPKYSWALSKIEGKGKLGKTKDLWKRSEKLKISKFLKIYKTEKFWKPENFWKPEKFWKLENFWKPLRFWKSDNFWNSPKFRLSENFWKSDHLCWSFEVCHAEKLNRT